MKKTYVIALAVAIMSIFIIFILNVSVSTKQGVNYSVHEIKLPLYLKILDFVDRHCNYKNLVSNIIGDTKDENAKIVKIFNWINSNMRKNPKDLPVIDDHPLNILIRGYGVADQFEDIFTILCTYAGSQAFFKMFKNYSGEVYFISFVEINRKWCPLSAFAGVYPNKNGAIASLDDILLDRKLLAPFESNLNNFDLNSFLKEIMIMDFKMWSLRAKGQSPIGRVACLIKNMFNCNQ